MSKIRLEFILFGELLQQPQTGYELQRFMEAAGRFMRANTSMTQVYRSLRAMEERGWLAHEIEPRLGAQDAKRYRVTSDGKSTFYEWLGEPYQPADEPGDPSFFTQLRFRAQYLGREAAIELIDSDIAHRRKQISRNRDRDRRERYGPDAPIDVALTSSLMEWEHQRGVARMDAHLAACLQLRELLAGGGLPCAEVPPLLLPAEQSDLAEQTSAEVS